MSDTNIEWADAVWNCIRGCTRVSPGCGGSDGGGCYAERQAIRQANAGGRYEGLVTITNGHPRWTGKVTCVESKLDEPLRWKKPRRIFVNSMSDLFHEGVPDEFLYQVFAVMALASQHTFQILTKRPERMMQFVSELSESISPMEEAARKMGYTFRWKHSLAEKELSLLRWPIPNVWLGVSVESQKYADERIPLLLQTPAAIRFLSVEPMLEAVNLDSEEMKGAHALGCGDSNHRDASEGFCRGVDWVICGGESGPGARPFNLAWAESLLEQCRAAGVPFFMKQVGSNPHDGDPTFCDERFQLKDRKGGDPAEWPKNLRVREFPTTSQKEAVTA